MTAGPRPTTLPAGHIWWRVADRDCTDPLDGTAADRLGGPWNAPGDGSTLYLCADVATARARIRRLLVGTAVDPEDLRDDAPFVLIPVRLPARQRVADATTDAGLTALGLPATYPRGPRGGEVARAACRRAARDVRAAGLRGIHVRSATTPDGPGRDLVWFPAPGARGRVSGGSRPFAEWRHDPTTPG